MTSYNIIVHGNNNQFSLVPSVLTPSLFIPVLSEIPNKLVFQALTGYCSKGYDG